MRYRAAARIGVLLLSVMTHACASGPAPAPVNSAGQDSGSRRVAVDKIAQEVAEGVGQVHQTNPEGTRGPVVIFEEFHTSRVGQLEIAIMLRRLHQRHNMKRIGLEGAIQATRPINAAWFHNMGGPTAKQAREDVAVRMLGEGEISSAEFMALLFPDLEVHGIELDGLYNKKHSLSGNPMFDYLVAIAEKGASQADLREVNRLINQKKTEEAIKHLMNADPWVREQYTFLERALGTQNARAGSCEEMRQRMETVQRKASEVGVQPSPQAKAQAEGVKDFYRTCEERSVAMVDRVVALAGTSGDMITAMIIGAAHTEGIVKLLQARKVSFAVITPTALNPEYGSLSNEQFNRKNKMRWARTSSGTLGALLNAIDKRDQRKPPPIIETATGKSYASANVASMLIALAARDRKRVPDDIWDQIKDLPECKVDRASFQIDENDVIFRMTLKNTSNQDRIVWARVGSADSPAVANYLEQKLLQARADLGGGGRIPPRQPPRNTTPAKDEGPGDGKRGRVTISRTGLRTIAVFGGSKLDVTRVGKVSG